MVCYREREGEFISPTLLCLNQQALRLTVKTIWMQVNSLHSMACSLLNKEGNLGHSSILTRRNSRRMKKPNYWPIDPQRQNAIFFFSFETFGKESSF